MAKLIVGVDIGKYFHQATVINESGEILGGSIRFKNSTDGAGLLLTRILSINPNNLPLVFGLEATGHYWLALCILSYLRKAILYMLLTPTSLMLGEKFTSQPPKLTRKIHS